MEYNEIWELFTWLMEEGFPCTIEHYLDGAIIELVHGDVVQHRGSYGSQIGCVEFGYTGFEDIDFCAMPLDKAKAIFLNNREYFSKMNI